MLSLILLELTLREVLSDLPMDGGGFIVLVMMVVWVGFLWLGSRGGSARARPQSRDAAERPPVDPSPPPATEPEPGDVVVFHPSTLSAAPDLRRAHPEVR